MNYFQTAFLFSAAALLQPAMAVTAADLDSLVARGSKYESGENAEPLRQIERLLCEAVGDPGRQAELEAALIRLLAPDATFEAKRFACTHLAVHGSEVSLPVLAGLLKQEETVGIACFALGGQRSAKAGAVLRAALPESKAAARLQIVSTLGHRAEAESVEPFVRLTRDADAVVAGAAIRALGLIDTPAARDALAALRQEAHPALAAAVAEASLSGAELLAASANPAAAAVICEALLTPASQPHIRRGAFGLLLRGDADGGVQRVRKALDARPPDAVIAAVAIAHIPALRGKGIAATFGGVLPRLPPSEQVLLIGAFARLADADARAILRSQVGSGDPCVRKAAIAAVGSLEDASAVMLLSKALAQASTPEETKDAQLALASLRGGETTDRAIGDVVRKAAAKDKPPLMLVLSRRGGPASVSVLLEQSGESDAVVARAASQALIRIADSGDSAALATLQAAVAGGAAPARETALRTLAAWRGVAAWESLAKVFLQPGNDAQHALALRGLVRIAGEGNAHPDAALIERYRTLLAGARRDEDRKLILSVLAGVGHPDALALALPLLEVPGAHGEAVEAVHRMATAIQTTHPAAARSALQKLVNEGNVP